MSTTRRDFLALTAGAVAAAVVPGANTASATASPRPTDGMDLTPLQTLVWDTIYRLVDLYPDRELCISLHIPTNDPYVASPFGYDVIDLERGHVTVVSVPGWGDEDWVTLRASYIDEEQWRFQTVAQMEFLLT